MEWLFLATKPSPLTPFGWRARLAAGAAVAAPVLAAAGGAVALCAAAAALARGRRIESALRLLAESVPAAVLALAALLLLDNFTHTVLGFGITATRGPARHLYALLLAALLLVSFGLVRRWERLLAPRLAARRAALAMAALALVLTAAAVAVTLGQGAAAPAAGESARPPRPFNVLLLGLDGVEAGHLSLYGYGRPTSPALDRLAREALVFADAFPNGGATSGSLVSILTGRLPTTTLVVALPDALAGAAARRHLPGLLKRRGYRTALVSVRTWADPVDLNLRGGFDWANSRWLPADAGAGASGEAARAAAAFRGALPERLGERLRRIFVPRLRPTAFEQVTRPIARADGWRLAELFGFLDRVEGTPFFAQLHLMQTHGPFYGMPREQRLFSRGRRQTGPWLDDFYDDAIRHADLSVAEVVDYLRARGLLDRTLLVVYSDHGRDHAATVRVPLLVRLPGGSPAARVAAPVQNLDIAPTVLDALGLPAPRWMEGRSLLRRELDRCRWIVSASGHDEPEPRPVPGFGELRQLGLVTGRRTFYLELATGALTERLLPPLPGAPLCDEATAAEARAYLLRHLRPTHRGGGDR